ncbi:MAG: lamin tail domain-containing protein [Patescibacteria group bacterium]|nr:lamin tail domain-containing protein [Patescibacteria group bacterium]
MLKRKKAGIFLFIFFLFIFTINFNQSKETFAYEIETHTYLTKEIVNFYNQNNPQNKIDEELIPFLIDGSRKEDEPPRWLNHFYDPIHNRGLFIKGIEYPSSKIWAQSESLQNSPTYKITATIASILTAIQQKKISALSTESAFIWKKALKQWIQGNKEEAMFTLGHILHLVEDLSVPDHARNDHHLRGSPYEEYALGKEITKRPQLNKIPSFEKLETYFDKLAKYSNENFFSKDAIGIQTSYQKPQSEITSEESGEIFILMYDKDGGWYRIALYKSPPNRFGYAITNKNNLSLVDKNKKIMNDYWSLLSVKAVEYGAGVIDLFFKEVEKNKNNPEFTQKEKGVLAYIYEIANQIINKVKKITSRENSFQEVAVIPIENTINQDEKAEGQPSQKTPSLPTNKSKEDKLDSLSLNQEKNPNITIPSKEETFLVSRVIDGDTIVLENNQVVRYLGIDAPEFSEEEKSECLGKEARDFNVSLVLGKKVFLKKNTTSSQDKDNFGRLLRYVYLESSPSKSINQMIIEAGLAYSYNFNHPHDLEDVFEDVEKGARQNQKGIWSPNKCLEKENQVQKEQDEKNLTLLTSQKKSCSFSTTQSPQRQSLIFNEIAWMGTTQSASDEWIEIKNISSQPINLSGWQIVDKNEEIKINLKEAATKTLLPGKFLLLERTDDNSVPAVSADLIYTGSLANSGEDLRLFDPNCNLADEVLASPSWPAGDNSSKRTMERNQSNLAWHTSSVVGGTPRQENSSPYQQEVIRGGGSSQQSESNQTQTIRDILINEIMYNPSGSDTDREWIEIYNAGSETVKVTDLKLNENDTNHRIEFSQGLENLIPGQYAVIADNPQKFLEDFPNFNGNLFDSSFSLGNDGEIIRITYQENIIDQYQYSSNTGANGNGKSLQKIEGIWQEANPTPGQPNQKEINQVNPVVPANHLVISEIQVRGENPEDEFIEIYNPTSETISLAGYSIQYLSGQAMTFENISKKNFEDNYQISPLGFFLLANSQSKFASQADLTFSFSLSGTSKGGGIFLVKSKEKITSINDPNIEDAFFYGSPIIGENSFSSLTESNQSFERKVVLQGRCLFAQEEGEFGGNNCDTDNSSKDFYIRTQALPQNTSNLPEPRQAPSVPQNLVVNFDKESLSLNLSWEASKDFLGNSQEISYQITSPEISQSDPIQTSETKQQVFIDEVEKEYSLFVRAFDKDKMPSLVAEAKIFVPGFIKNLSFFKHPLEDQYLIEINFEDYPFIPSVYPKPTIDGWKAVVFYLNSPPLKEIRFTNSFDNKTQGISEKALSLNYLPCAGNNLPTKHEALFLADDNTHCRLQEGPYSLSLNLNQIEDKNIILPIADFSSQEKELTEKDFVSIGYYAVENLSGLGETTYKLIAADKRNFFFNKEFPLHQSPSTPANFQARKTNGENDNFVLLSWDNSTDPDSLDEKITYQFNYHKKGELLDNSHWQTIQKAFGQAIENGNLITTQIEPKIGPLEKGEYLFYLRAQDEIGLASEPAVLSLSIEPLEIIAQAPLQSMRGNLGFKTGGSESPVSEAKVAQSFYVKNPSLIKEINLSLGSFQENPPIQAKISIQTEDDNHLPSGNKLTEIVLENISRWQGEPKFQKIILPNPLQINPGRYFLVMETQGAEEASNQYLITLINNQEAYPEEGVYLFSRLNNSWIQYLSWFNDQPFLKDIYFEIKGIIAQ